jgi:small subunit ribosomal protein S1
MAPETQTAEEVLAPTVKENFAEMLEESLGADGRFEGRVVTGTILAVENDDVLIDVGLKSEGRVSLKEFGSAEETAEIKLGDTVDVFV